MDHRINTLMSAGDEIGRDIGRRVILASAHAKREAQQYAKFPDALRGAIVGAPADPEAFG